MRHPLDQFDDEKSTWEQLTREEKADEFARELTGANQLRSVSLADALQLAPAEAASLEAHLHDVPSGLVEELDGDTWPLVEIGLTFFLHPAMRDPELDPVTKDNPRAHELYELFHIVEDTRLNMHAVEIIDRSLRIRSEVSRLRALDQFLRVAGDADPALALRQSFLLNLLHRFAESRIRMPFELLLSLLPDTRQELDVLLRHHPGRTRDPRGSFLRALIESGVHPEIALRRVRQVEQHMAEVGADEREWLLHTFPVLWRRLSEQYGSPAHVLERMHGGRN